MLNKNLNDFIIDIYQDNREIESFLKILQKSLKQNETEVEKVDIENSLEILISKIININKSMDKFIDMAFSIK